MSSDPFTITEEFLVIYHLNRLYKIIEILLKIIHYQSCLNKNCIDGNICIPVKLSNLNVKKYNTYADFYLHAYGQK